MEGSAVKLKSEVLSQTMNFFSIQANHSEHIENLQFQYIKLTNYYCFWKTIIVMLVKNYLNENNRKKSLNSFLCEMRITTVGFLFR